MAPCCLLHRERAGGHLKITAIHLEVSRDCAECRSAAAQRLKTDACPSGPCGSILQKPIPGLPWMSFGLVPAWRAEATVRRTRELPTVLRRWQHLHQRCPALPACERGGHPRAGLANATARIPSEQGPCQPPVESQRSMCMGSSGQ